MTGSFTATGNVIAASSIIVTGNVIAAYNLVAVGRVIVTGYVITAGNVVAIGRHFGRWLRTLCCLRLDSGVPGWHRQSQDIAQISGIAVGYRPG